MFHFFFLQPQVPKYAPRVALSPSAGDRGPFFLFLLFLAVPKFQGMPTQFPRVCVWFLFRMHSSTSISVIPCFYIRVSVSPLPTSGVGKPAIGGAGGCKLDNQSNWVGIHGLARELRLVPRLHHQLVLALNTTIKFFGITF